MHDREHSQQLEELAQRFVWFAKHDCQRASPLYEHLSTQIARDPEILELATYARPGQPVPNLLFGAVQFLLLQGVQHPLAAFYFSIPASSSKQTDPYQLFRSFCFEHWAEIQQLVATHLVQTNEVRRCACLLPAFALVARRTQRRPLSLVEIGASAGLNLLWDQYGYDYGESQRCGSEQASVQLHCTLRGDKRPALPTTFPPVASRVGIDLNPIDVHDPTATLWLRALIWPEHDKRVQLLTNALAVARQHTPTVLAGDALALLPDVMAAIPGDTTLCFYHTFVINQFSPVARKQLAALFAHEATKRDLYVVSIAWQVGELPILWLFSYEAGVKTETMLARCSGHARWMEWL
ncbi:MAG: DUF2332 domain-containing protein [Ktedonobacteraceae bacterium]